MDVLDWVRGKISDRRISNLIEQLPWESATTRAIAGAEPGRHWSETNYQLADVTDLLNNLLWVTVKAHSQGFDEPPPEPVSRPIQPPEPEIPETKLEDMAAWFGAMREAGSNGG